MFQRTRNNILSAIFAVALAILIITVSIGLPIYVRPFYYAHINILDLPENTGYTQEEIVDAYDEVLDYLTIEGNEFGTGVLEYSEEGKSHFEDCKVLFDLNKNALLISLVVVVLLAFLDKMHVIELARPLGFRMTFWSPILTLGGAGVLGLACLADFDTAFTVFHKIMFPGKDNWVFHPYKDEIINILPEQFFMDCAILICVSVLAMSTFFIVRGIIKRNNDYVWRV